MAVKKLEFFFVFSRIPKPQLFRGLWQRKMTTKDVLPLETQFSGKVLTAEQVSAVKATLIANKSVTLVNYDLFLGTVFPSLIASLRDYTGVGDYRVKVVDCIAIWALRSNQLAARDHAFKHNLNNGLFVTNCDYLIQYVIDFWNETGSPLSNALKDLFNKLINLIKNSVANSQALFKTWIDKIMLINPSRRVLYVLIETLNKELDSNDYIVVKFPKFIESSINEMKSKILANIISKALLSIYKKLYTDEDSAEYWMDTYWQPIFTQMNSGSDSQITENILTFLLPNLFKLSRNGFKLFVSRINKQQNQLDLFISCLNIGQNLAIEDDPFPNLISRDLISSLLKNPVYKIKVLKLLTSSAKGSKLINVEVLDILRLNLDIFFNDIEIETRNEFISSFKHFMSRLKDSSYSLARDSSKLYSAGFTDQSEAKLAHLDHYKEFLHWCIDFFKYQIKPNSQYHRVTTGLNLLNYLVDIGLDSGFTPVSKLNINFPDIIKFRIFDKVLIKLLFDNLLSTYDDIRNYSMVLINKSNYEITETEKQNLIDKSFKMLNNYSNSESGAKILECLYLIFKDDSIIDKLLEEMPINYEIKQAVNHPVDGFFNSLELIISHNKNYANSEKLIQISETIWFKVKDILSHDSPEGCDNYDVGSSQLVLSYAWRSTKQSTLLLQQVLDLELTNDQLLRIGELVLDQLSTVRHRGAFSSVYPTFIKVAEKVSKRLPNQIKSWLDLNIDTISNKTQSISRRSGGLPFLITAVITVDNELIEYAFNKLIQIAQVPVNEKEDGEKMDIPQVHASNCLKAIFTESQLSTICSPYVYKALELSLLNFSSKIWSMRNCSIMLFTALQNRLFTKKKLNSRVFFSRYKGIKEILIKILQNSIDLKNLETLFPVLTILSRLESSSGYNELDDFKPLLKICLSTKYWKVREAASRALPSLIEKFDVEALELIRNCSITNQNKLHGHLLAIVQLNVYSAELVQEVFSKSAELFYSNPSFVTSKAFVTVLFKCLEVQHNEEIVDGLRQWVLKENQIYEINGAKQLLLSEIFSGLLQYKMLSTDQVDELLLNSLRSKFFEVQLVGIEYCQKNGIADNEELNKLGNDDGTWIFIRSKVLPLLRQFDTAKLFEFVKNEEFSEDIKNSAIILLGDLVPVDAGSEEFKEYVGVVEDCLDEDLPYTVRIAGLQSVIRYLERDGENAQCLFLCYKFLSDDDEEIRELASSHFNKGEEVIPWVAADEFSKQFGSTESAKDVILREFLRFKPNYSYKTSSNEVIFAVEKKNLYRNEFEQNLQLLRMLKNCHGWFSKEDERAFSQHIEELHAKVVSFFQQNPDEMFIGWTSNGDVFEQVFGSLNYVKEWHFDQALFAQLAQQGVYLYNL